MTDGFVGPDLLALQQVQQRLQRDDLRVVFQPVLDLGSANIFAYEALVRAGSGPGPDPASLIGESVRLGCIGALGRVIRRLAVEGCPGHNLFLNVHPSEFNEGWLVRPDDPIFEHPHPVFLEITESVPLSHFALCDSVLREIRGKGVSLAVDDLGAGYSNLKYICDLNPDIVKLDRSLVSNVASEPRLQTLVSSVVRLCEDLGAKVVAEGIETPDELHAIQDSGAHFGQGFLISRPSPQVHDTDILDPGLR